MSSAFNNNGWVGFWARIMVYGLCGPSWGTSSDKTLDSRCLLESPPWPKAQANRSNFTEEMVPKSNTIWGCFSIQSLFLIFFSTAQYGFLHRLQILPNSNISSRYVLIEYILFFTLCFLRFVGLITFCLIFMFFFFLWIICSSTVVIVFQEPKCVFFFFFFSFFFYNNNVLKIWHLH